MIPFLDLKKLNAPYEDEIARAVTRIARSGRYIGGDEVAMMEHQLATYHGVDCAVGVSNGLDALTLILLGYIEMGRLAQGDAVIVPANTYIATILAITRAGLEPLLVEPSITTLNLDSNLLEDTIAEREKSGKSPVRGIMVVHLYGRVCWDERLVNVAHLHGLLVIEDNAQGIGARSIVPGFAGTYMAGSLGDAAALSFYPTKNLGAMGDGGAVLTRDADLAATVRALANYGSDRRYHNLYKGFNCRLDPMQVAVVSVKLPSLDSDNRRRRDIAAQYRALVADNESIKLYVLDNDEALATNYHQLVAIVSDRDSFRSALEKAGIGTDVHYATPPHRQPCYSGEFGDLQLPLTDYIADHIVSLPIAPYLTDAEVAHITATISGYRPG